MTDRSLHQSIVIIQPTLNRTANDTGVGKPEIKKTIKAVARIKPVTDLPRSAYTITDKPNLWMTPINAILAVLVAVGNAMLYLVDGIGYALESTINGASSIMSAIHSKFISAVAWFIAPSFCGVCYVA